MRKSELKHALRVSHRSQNVRMLGVQRKVGSPTLHREAAALGYDARAESEVVRVDERNGVSCFVHDLEAHRARAFGGVSFGYVRRCSCHKLRFDWRIGYDG